MVLGRWSTPRHQTKSDGNNSFNNLNYTIYYQKTILSGDKHVKLEQPPNERIDCPVRQVSMAFSIINLILGSITSFYINKDVSILNQSAKESSSYVGNCDSYSNC